MYDSRSSHPHKGVHAPRSWREMGEGDRIEWGTPRTRVLATPHHARLAIAEGLAECEEEPYTFGLFAEVEAERLEDPEPDPEWDAALALNATR